MEWSRLLHREARPLVGIDIGASAVKLLALSRGEKAYHIDHFAIEPLKAGAVVEKQIKDHEAVVTALRRALRVSGCRIREAAVAVGGNAVISKVIRMPLGLSDSEMEEQISLEADQHISYPIDEINLDFQVMGESGDDEHVDVLLAASRSEYVESHVAVLQDVGLEARVVDVEAFVLENACLASASLLPNAGKDKTIALIDIGTQMSTVNVLDDLKSIYVREQMFGGQQLLNAMQQNYGWVNDEALEHLFQHRLPEDFETTVLNEFRQSVAQQISRSLQYFYTSAEKQVDLILLSGASATLPGMVEAVTEEADIEVACLNPLATQSVAPGINALALERQAPSLVVAFGLALRRYV